MSRVERATGGDFDGAPDDIQTPLGAVSAIDLTAVDARIVVSESGLDVTVDLWFWTSGGRPALELEPNPVEVFLDGSEVSWDRAQVSEPPRDLLVLPAFGEGEEHQLSLSYSLPLGWLSEDGEAVRLESLADGVFWASGYSDASAGRFLSIWLPSNLLFDSFDLSMEIDVSGLDTDHRFIVNGELEQTDSGWLVRWTDISAHSPFWVLSPSAITGVRSQAVDLESGRVQVEVRGLTTDSGADLDQALERAIAALESFSDRFGPYQHGGQFVLWIRDDVPSSMEYNGATLTQMWAIEHEILHSWFGRGAMPLTDVDGWIDEALTAWAADANPLREAELDTTSAPVKLQRGLSAWAGPTLGIAQYHLGSALFADIAHRNGVDALSQSLAEFVALYAGSKYRAGELEEHLSCSLDDDLVRASFRHTGYGLTGDAPDRPSGWCE